MLDLSGNSLGSAGVKLLVEGLKTHSKLRSLLLDQNGICSEGAQAVATLFSSDESNVMEVHLRDNLISAVGLQSIL